MSLESFHFFSAMIEEKWRLRLDRGVGSFVYQKEKWVDSLSKKKAGSTKGKFEAHKVGLMNEGILLISLSEEMRDWVDERRIVSKLVRFQGKRDPSQDYGFLLAPFFKFLMEE